MVHLAYGPDMGAAVAACSVSRKLPSAVSGVLNAAPLASDPLLLSRTATCCLEAAESTSEPAGGAVEHNAAAVQLLCSDNCCCWPPAALKAAVPSGGAGPAACSQPVVPGAQHETPTGFQQVGCSTVLTHTTSAQLQGSKRDTSGGACMLKYPRKKHDTLQCMYPALATSTQDAQQFQLAPQTHETHLSQLSKSRHAA
jgi:hypothetical protein